jgi:hypothetical protein
VKSVKSAVKLFVFVAVITSSADAAEEKPALSTCSLRYGNLMVSHWLTVDLLRQIERGLSYQAPAEPSSLRAEFEKLQQSVSSSERQLNHALGLYRSLSATNSPEGIIQLSDLLGSAAQAENQNDQIAVGLLRNLGESIGAPGFQPLPISKADLAPAWGPASGTNWARGEQSKLLAKNFRPHRILFGCTGRAGDDRTLVARARQWPDRRSHRQIVPRPPGGQGRQPASAAR